MRRVLLPSVCVVLQLVSVHTGHDRAAGAWADALSAVVALGTGLVLLARHRRPEAVLAACAGGYVAQVLLVGPVLPAAIVAMVFLVARARVPAATSARGSVLVVAGALVAMAVALLAAGHPYQAAPYGLLVMAAATAGLLLAARTAREESHRAELLADQRLRIARDLHDIVGHGMGAITVQAGAARLAVAAGAPDDATRSLVAIEGAGRSMLREVRWLVGLLREESAAPTLSDVGDLVANARRSGLAVSYAAEGALETVPVAVGEAGYRIVQEALTNVVRHARSAEVDVRVVVGTDVELQVVDTAAPTGDAAAAPGNGIRGMRERAVAVGGSLDAGPRDAGGWTVRATLALERGR